jgi:hypothetical protein
MNIFPTSTYIYHIFDVTIFPTHPISDINFFTQSGDAGGGSPLINFLSYNPTIQSRGARGSSPVIYPKVEKFISSAAGSGAVAPC